MHHTAERWDFLQKKKFPPLCSSAQSVTVFAYIRLSRQLHFQVCHTARSKVPEGFQLSFLEDELAESIFGERGVAAWLLLLMEQLIKGSSLQFLPYFWHFSSQVCALCLCHHFLALYTEAAPLFLYLEPMFHITTLHFIQKLLNSSFIFNFLYNGTICINHVVFFVYFNIKILEAESVLSAGEQWVMLNVKSGCACAVFPCGSLAPARGVATYSGFSERILLLAPSR